MKKKLITLCTFITLSAIAAGSICVMNKGQFKNIVNAADGQYRHYQGIAAGCTGAGLKEYWTDCKGTTTTTDPQQSPYVEMQQSDSEAVLADLLANSPEDERIIPTHNLEQKAEVAPKCDGTDGKKNHDHCSVCGKDFVNGVEKSANDLKIPFVDKYHSTHDFDENGVCKDCGNILISNPIKKTTASNQLAKDSETVRNAVKTPGIWYVAGSNADNVKNSLDSTNEQILCNAGKFAYIRTIPNKDILDNGGVFYAEFDIKVLPEENGIFKFGSGTSNEKGDRYKIDIAHVKEATLNKIYHVELIVKLQAGKYWQISFENYNKDSSTNTINMRVAVQNIKMLQLKGDSIPDSVKSGVNVYSYPTEWTPSIVVE